MSDNSNDAEKVVIYTTKLRNDAGKRLGSDGNNKSGITRLNEGSGSGISHEFFTKDEEKSSTSTDKDNSNKDK